MKETEHARQRREERGIDKKDLKEALKYGKELPCMYGRKYKYKGLIYIVDRRRKKEITCYAESLQLKEVKLSNDMELQLRVAKDNLAIDLSCWKSNTVLVVDTSGSMRESDVWGARSRLDAVWMCIALDFIAHRIESGNAGFYDAVSVILLGETAPVLIDAQPTSWELYNTIVNIYNNRSVPAKSLV